MLLCCSDEGTPYNYFVCCPTWTERLEGLMARFWADMRTACPDFSPAASSVVPELGEGEALAAAARGETDGVAGGSDITGFVGGAANLTTCPTWLVYKHDCLAMTLEMPFKDNAELPIAETAWDGPRSAAFGKAVVEPLLRSLPHLR